MYALTFAAAEKGFVQQQHPAPTHWWLLLEMLDKIEYRWLLLHPVLPSSLSLSISLRTRDGIHQIVSRISLTVSTNACFCGRPDSRAVAEGLGITFCDNKKDQQF